MDFASETPRLCDDSTAHATPVTAVRGRGPRSAARGAWPVCLRGAGPGAGAPPRPGTRRKTCV